MRDLSPQEFEVASLIVDALNLEDVSAGDIKPDTPLFRDGLGLDSIDALELSLALKQKYGFQIQSNNEQNVRMSSTLATLTDHVQHNRTDDQI